MKPGVCGVLIFVAVSFVACGGGGGGGGGSSGGTVPVPSGSVTVSSSPAPTTSPSPVATAAALSVSGTAQEFTTGAALGGFTVTVGSLPNAATCLSTESAMAMPCGVPVSPLPTIVTSATGAFSIAVPSAGTYMLTIGKDATYATLHRTVTVTAGASLALGTVKIAALSSDEQAWLIDVNTQRATVSVPVSFANLTVDEYAEEQARAEVAAIANGVDPFGDPTEAIFNSNYSAQAGAIYGPASVAALVGSASAFLQADANWMAEKPNCSNGNWQTCAFGSSTGHYVNISNTQDVWVGLAESTNSFSDSPYGTEWAYAMLLPENLGSASPESSSRAR